MTSLGYSLVSGSNQVLQPNLPGANPSNAHFTDPIPQFSSKVEAVAGCGGAGGSAAALAAHPGYNVAVKQTGGGDSYSHRRGGSKRRHHGKRHSSKRHHGKGKGNGKRHSSKRHCKCRGKCHCKRQNRRRSMRGGLSALSPDSFSGANLPYHQFTGSQPLSFNYGLGSQTPLPPALSGMANPPPMMDIHNNCGSNHGLVGKGLLN